ncbi:MAG: HEAT repeat domain-containing protein [Bacteroidota bacterium]|nr:HEAT repeat domain-containing protein [Bacteroidota bacterium]
MNKLEKLERRWNELSGKPKNKEEIEETLLLGKEIELERAKEYSLMIIELKEKGIAISSVWDLVNTNQSYPNAIPILIEHLPKDYHEKNKEGIVRALAVKDAIGKASPVLIAEYNRTSKDKTLLRWAIGNTIYTTITENDVDSILPIVQDKTNGMSRQMFVAALGKVKSEKTENVLIDLLDDEEVAPQALEALGKMKSVKAKGRISVLSKHSNPLIRKEAEKALKKIT